METSSTPLGKRMASNEVLPFVLNGIRYTAPESFVDADTGDILHGGVVVAEDEATHAELWRAQAYHQHYQEDLERDVQEVFLVKLYAEDGNLAAEDERGNVYLLNLVTGAAITTRQRA